VPIQVSVVVPTFKRPDLLERCLAALEAQDFDPAAYEVIVADDEPSETTRQRVEVRAAQARTAIRYVAVPDTHGPAAARNAGWRQASGEIIAFTDDDTVPDPGWLRSGVAAFVDGVVGAAGQIVVPLADRPTDYQRNEARLEHAQFATANCFYRRAALEAVGGFDERFTSAWREDSDLYFTLLERVGTDGQVARLVHAPEAIVVHPVRPAPWGISLAQQRKSFFNALLYKKHPHLYRKMIQTTPPLHYYLIVSALLTALIAAGIGDYGSVLPALGVWAFLTGCFCINRLRDTAHDARHISEVLLTSLLIPPLSVFWRILGALKFRVFFF
jgi:glycosyltransferase involved in cell wall biosynthesis